MRIAYVTADFGVPVFGGKGASVHVRELTRALQSQGHDVLILTARVGGEAPPDFDVRVLEVAAPPGQEVAGRDLELRAGRYAAELHRRGRVLLQRFRPDLVYERYSLFGTGGRMLAGDLGVPLILEVNAPLADEHAAHRGGLADRRRARSQERRILRSADRVVAVSSWLERWLVGLGVDRRRIALVPNGVDPGRFRPARDEVATVRRQLGGGGRPLIGFLGSLKPWHDVDTLVRALALLGHRSSDPLLVLLGDGPERARLEALVRRRGLDSRAIFVGAIAYDRVPAYLAALDVAIAPYRPGACYFSPLKLFEYLGAARPTVAAAVGDIPHCIVPGQTGSLYRAADTRALAREISALLDNPSRAAALGRGGRDHVRTHHTWHANARRVVELVHDDLAIRRAS
jgi:glycosyltransferase involved in cell wall biosynthesis